MVKVETADPSLTRRLVEMDEDESAKSRTLSRYLKRVKVSDKEDNKERFANKESFGNCFSYQKT